MKRFWIAMAVLLSTIFLAPYLVLLALGFVWLTEHGWMMVWLLAAAISSLAACVLHFGLRRFRDALPSWHVKPTPAWTPTDHQAWNEVQQIAQQAGSQSLSLGRPDEIQKLLEDILTAAAKAYFPRASEPLLEVSVPNALAMVELVAHDLRAISETLPGGRTLSVGQVRRWQQTSQTAMVGLDLAYSVYRVARLIYNPTAALIGEARGIGTRNAWDWLRQDFQRRAQAYSVELAGKYAIELYSGRIQLRKAEVQQFVTARSRQDLATSAAKQRQRVEEPLRVLVLGQVKAGKSSLINALFGEVRAAVDVIPCTRIVEPFLLLRDERTEAIVFDTAGYEDIAAARSMLDDLRVEAKQADLILLTVSASQAARAPDQMILRTIKQAFDDAPGRQPPPCIVALTHIDRLRPPQAWAPPYDLTSEEPKARSIRDAVAAVAEELTLPLESIVPVCLMPGRLYNVSEALMPLLVHTFSTAERSRVARLLAAYHDETQWSALWQQAIRSGRLAIGTLGSMYNQSAE